LPVEIRAAASVPGVLENALAVVKGISASGLRVMLSAAVDPGSMIALDIGNGVVFGEVKQSQASGEGHHQTEVSLDEFLERPEYKTPHADDRPSGRSRGFFRRLFSRQH
jgi:hypothetical protein